MVYVWALVKNTEIIEQQQTKTKMSKKKKENKKIRDKNTTTLKEMEEKGIVPENFHLYDSVDMKEYNNQFDGYKEWEEKQNQKEDE